MDIHEHIKEGWWKEIDSGITRWKPRVLSEEWKQRSISSLLKCPRGVAFYSNPRFKERIYPTHSLLDDCSAVEFIKLGTEGRRRVVFLASEDYPCEIEMGTMEEHCDMLLKGLEKTEIRRK